MTTIATPISATTSPNSTASKIGGAWIAILVAVVAVAALAVATIIIVNSSDSAGPAITAVHVAGVDTVAHGGNGRVFTTDGHPVTVAKAATEADLLVHGGPGSAVTVAGERLR